MSFSGQKRIMYSYLAVLLIFSALHSRDCKVGATRIQKAVEDQEEQSQSQNIKKVHYNESQLLHRVYNHKVSDHNRGLQPNKRMVPSCPDPLHNKFNEGCKTNTTLGRRRLITDNIDYVYCPGLGHKIEGQYEDDKKRIWKKEHTILIRSVIEVKRTSSGQQ